MTRWVVFTDLDDSLLDSATYSFDRARPALDELRRRGVPLVFVTSKTAAEGRVLQRRMGIDDPMVIEAGGGIVVPKGRFESLPAPATEQDDHFGLALSAPYATVLAGFDHLQAATQGALRGFHEMSVREVSERSGLPEETAALARRREFDEPFVFVRREAEFAPRLGDLAGAVGLRVSRGARFYHLHGEVDKGTAVRLLKTMYVGRLGPIRTIGVGDSAIDAPLLVETDVAVVIPRRDGQADPALVAARPDARLAPACSSEGWNAALLDILGR